MPFSVSVSSGGRFHAFELARQMCARGQLRRLYTGYPRSRVYEVPRQVVRSHPLLMSTYMALEGRGLRSLSRYLLSPVAQEYGRWVASALEPCDVFVSLSSFGLEAFRRARREGIATVCDRGSVHIETQRDILQEEYRRFGVPFGMRGNPMDAGLLAREVAEYDLADLITVPSSVARRSFLQRGFPPERVVRIPCGVDLSVYRPLPKRDDIFRVLFVGAAGLQKGIGYLLEAIEPLRLPKFEVMLVGGVTPDARRLIERNRDRIVLRGFVPRLQLADVYSQGSVLVLPSVQEGLALVQAQAMACGLPVIATPNTGAEDLFSDGIEGFIVPARDPGVLRDRIEQLYENPEMRAAMGARALERVREVGSWERYGSMAVQTYAELLQQNRPGTGRALTPGKETAV